MKITEYISHIIKITMHRIRSNIKFLIIDLDYNEGKVVFLCYGGKAFFKRNLFDAIVDDKLISGLHPEQACFLGIMVSRWLKENNIIDNAEKYQKILRRHNYNAAVEDSIVFDRHGNLIYTDKQTGELQMEMAHVVASKKDMISRFHSLVACSIGIFVGNNLRRLNKFESSDLKGHLSSESNNIIPLSNFITNR